MKKPVPMLTPPIPVVPQFNVVYRNTFCFGALTSFVPDKGPLLILARIVISVNFSSPGRLQSITPSDRGAVKRFANVVSVFSSVVA